MKRIFEPDLMEGEEQALAYARADFAEPHNRFVELFREHFPSWQGERALDLGCGPADITIRFARAFPHCKMTGIDGSLAMLRHGEEAVQSAGLAQRIELLHSYLPDESLPVRKYDAIISNSLLHHLKAPLVLWDTVAMQGGPGMPVFVMDLMRPDSREEAERLTELYSANEPDILRNDFFNSLLAAYRPEEVAEQLAVAGLDQFKIRVVSDRHFIVHGRIRGKA